MLFILTAFAALASVTNGANFVRALAHQLPTRHYEAIFQHGNLGDPELYFYTHPKSVWEGESSKPIQLHCAAYGTPTPVVYWLKNGKRFDGLSREGPAAELLSNMGHNTHQTSASISVLHIPCPSEEDSGKYTCVATNGVFTITTHSDVEVTGEATCTHPSGSDLVTDFRLERSGVNVQMFCRSSRGEVHWLDKNGSRLVESPKRTLLDNGDLLLMNIDPATRLSAMHCEVEAQEGTQRYDSFVYAAKYNGEDEQ